MDQIRRVRDNKINQGLELVTGPLTAKLNNLCCMELNTLRPFFLGSLDRFLRISRVRPAKGQVSGYIIAAAADADGAAGSCNQVVHALASSDFDNCIIERCHADSANCDKCGRHALQMTKAPDDGAH